MRGHCYTPDPECRDFFRSTHAHSTVVIDGGSQAVTTGAFKWNRRPRAWLRQWSLSDTVDVAEGEHDAYATLPDPVRHRRRIIFMKPRYWLIVDDVSGTAMHDVDVLWQFGDLDVAIDTDQWVRARHPAGHALMVRTFALSSLGVDRVSGVTDPMRGWISDGYGKRRPAPLVTYHAAGVLPLRMATILLPLADGSAGVPPSVETLPAPDGLLGALHISTWNETVMLDGR
jgi:hypothetical protein